MGKSIFDAMKAMVRNFLRGDFAPDYNAPAQKVECRWIQRA